MLKDVKKNNLDSEIHRFPPTYIIFQLSKKTKKETVHWLVEKITRQRQFGGAELYVKAQEFTNGQRLTFHVSANHKKLLELAEELEIKKKDRFGNLREFTVKELNEFTSDVSEYNLLSTAEKQVLVQHELENVRALFFEKSVPGYPNISLYEGQSIMSVCKQKGIVKQILPLHDEEEIMKLGASWYMALFSEQPYEKIREYFGESIALYFHFLGFYTSQLFVPMLLGFLQLLISSNAALPVFCIINIIYATVMLEMWKRKCNELAFVWGTISMNSFDEPRSNFRGVMGIDIITGKMLPQYPRWKTNAKMYLVSLPLVVLCMMGAFVIMLLYFYIENQVLSIPDVNPIITFLPSAIYTALIYIMNMMYRIFANFLTEWENHRTQSQFDRHRVSKLVLFEFVNNFMALFYIAFVIQDVEMLRKQIAIQMIILQAINNVQEALIPLVIRHFFSKVKGMSSKEGLTECKDPPNYRVKDIGGLRLVDPEDADAFHAIKQAQRDVYEDPYDDYLELFVQFGYVFLFSAVYPIAAFWAVFNNLLEIRSDAFKLCCVLQRPFAKRVKDTGAWQRAFQFLSSVSVVTNILLLCISPSMRSLAPDISDISWILCFVFLEHCLLLIRLIIHFVIPDKPEWVKVALVRGNYLSKQALKLHRLTEMKNKEISTQKSS